MALLDSDNDDDDGSWQKESHSKIQHAWRGKMEIEIEVGDHCCVKINYIGSMDNRRLI